MKRWTSTYEISLLFLLYARFQALSPLVSLIHLFPLYSINIANVCSPANKTTSVTLNFSSQLSYGDILGIAW